MRAQEIIRDLLDKLTALDASLNSSDGSEPGPVDVDNTDQSDDPTMVPPLQQNMELRKAVLGKQSEVIDDILDDEPPGDL